MLNFIRCVTSDSTEETVESPGDDIQHAEGGTCIYDTNGLEVLRQPLEESDERVRLPDEQQVVEGKVTLPSTLHAADHSVSGLKCSAACEDFNSKSILDLPASVLQEIYGWVPERVCSDTVVCKWFRETLPESKAVELRVLRGRGVNEEYIKRFSSNNQRIWFVCKDHKKSFDSCIMRSLLSVLSDVIANVVSLDFSGLLYERFPVSPKDEETDSATKRIVFYITAFVRNAPNLERIVLKQNDIPDMLAAMIVAGLAERTGLKEIDVSNTGFDTFATLALASLIFKNSGLQRISLAGNTIGEVSLEQLSLALQECPNLTDLDVGGLGNFVSTFFPCLIANRNIRHFSAGSEAGHTWNGIKTALVLSQCACQLVSLDLSSGSLRTQGCKYLARLFARSTALERLALCACEVTADGARLLAGADRPEARTVVTPLGEQAGPTLPTRGGYLAALMWGGEEVSTLLERTGEAFGDVLPECVTRLQHLHRHHAAAVRPVHDSPADGLTRLTALDLRRNPGPAPRPLRPPPRGVAMLRAGNGDTGRAAAARAWRGRVDGGRVGRGGKRGTR